MINAPLIFKINNYIRNLPNEKWDFAQRSGCPSCWLGNAEIGFNILKTNDHLGISKEIITKIFLGCDLYDSHYTFMKSIPKEDICNLVDRYTTYKLRQEHKWKQWEYRHFGQAVTDKRGICV